jgi:hypothetical protein
MRVVSAASTLNYNVGTLDFTNAGYALADTIRIDGGEIYGTGAIKGGYGTAATIDDLPCEIGASGLQIPKRVWHDVTLPSLTSGGGGGTVKLWRAAIPSELTRETPDVRVQAFLENAEREGLSQRHDSWRNL